jgi:uncharacterized protein (TIGR02328 family)
LQGIECYQWKGVEVMRLWHYELLPCLDDFHIVAQYRELLAIKRAIEKNGTPNHRLVNKVLNYDISHFQRYAMLVKNELEKRGIAFMENKMYELILWQSNRFCGKKKGFALFDGWHNHKYLTQCYYNLEEKHDCGIVSDEAWEKINHVYRERYIKGE